MALIDKSVASEAMPIKLIYHRITETQATSTGGGQLEVIQSTPSPAQSKKLTEYPEKGGVSPLLNPGSLWSPLFKSGRRLWREIGVFLAGPSFCFGISRRREMFK